MNSPKVSFSFLISKKVESSLSLTIFRFLEGSARLREGSTSASGSFPFRCVEPRLREGTGVDGCGEYCKGVLKQKVSE
jgi:hypothetical protein